MLDSIQSPYEQGSPEWLQMRKNKITGTDAPIIMGESPWKSPLELYAHKISDHPQMPITDRMQRGVELEPIARDLFTLKTGLEVEPKVVVKGWAMASLDGISKCGRHLVEIKCPSDKAHALALAGRIPTYYYAQLQHQMFVCNLDGMYYFSFDGEDGVVVEVDRNQPYIDRMVEAELRFYECLINRTPPDSSETPYTRRDDYEWSSYASLWMGISRRIKELEQQQEDLRQRLVFMSGQSNCKGGGISLCRVQKKGNVDYSKIPELRGVDLEKYRKEPTEYWRVSFD